MSFDDWKMIGRNGTYSSEVESELTTTMLRPWHADRSRSRWDGDEGEVQRAGPMW